MDIFRTRHALRSLDPLPSHPARPIIRMLGEMVVCREPLGEAGHGLV